jgi:hypothetical protein
MQDTGMSDRIHPPALPHGDLREVLPGIHFVTGTIAMPGPLPVTFSRNMTVIREGERLVLVNSLRLNERGLAALDALGKVTDVIRLAANHGIDDAFYAQHYGARVWAVRGQKYIAGFSQEGPSYFTPSVEMEASTPLPLEGAKLVTIGSSPPEGILLLERQGGIAISGDCLQNWAKVDPYFSFLGRLMMKMFGFIKPHNIGPGWLRQGKPPKEHLRGILDHDFAIVFPGHGEPVLRNARDSYRAAIERVSA